MKEVLWNRNYIAVCTANFLLFFAFYLLLPMLPLYLRDTFSADRQLIGIILSGYTITALLIRPFGGFIVDSFPRKQVLLICYFLFFAFFAGYIVAGTVLLFAIIRSLHGFAFGAVTVANSTMAIDVLPASRRNEGIGYYGVSNNLAMAIGPSISMYLYDHHFDANIIFIISLVAAAVGLACNASIKAPAKEITPNKQPISLDRFILTNATPEVLMVMFFSFAYGILSTYLAIYGKDEIGIENGSGLFFTILAIGLISARIFSAQWVKRGLLTLNIGTGMIITIVGYLIFTFWRNELGFYLSATILGAGYGAMCPSFQAIFVNLAHNNRRGTANSTYLTSWDLGLGIGVLIGGAIAQRLSYHDAFIVAVIVCAIGAIHFFTHTAKHFNKNKLR
ncbi:MAG: MFS transporter [Muribaculaceae bacterium]|nr:MFS transporter [Muribaculaceae bacterium]